MITHLRAALALTLVLTVITGIAYPLAMTGIAQTVFGDKAQGSLIELNGEIVGSELIGQNFVDPATGLTIVGYFRGRPSAAGTGYDAAASSGSNLGPTNRALIDRVEQEIALIRRENALADDAMIPVDLVTASASGLDPAISPASAELQIERVAKQRGIPVESVEQLVDQATEGRTLGILGEPRVNVVKLNLLLDRAYPIS